MKQVIQYKPFSERPLRLAFHELESLINSLGWSADNMINNDFPYNTIYWTLTPVNEDHINSDEIKKFLYACGYFDIRIDYKQKEIYVYV